MGPGESAGEEVCAFAESTGAALAKAGFVVLSGGRAEGVMEAAMKGAANAGGLTIGILPGSDKKGMSEYVEIPVFTGIGHARNAVNVLSSEMVVAIGLGPGTASEVSMAIKMKKPVILACMDELDVQFFSRLGEVVAASTPEDIVTIIRHKYNQNAHI
ncbi:hypothetical protein CLV93_104270 [Prolixibacter denitrificans]|uniref:TIGR00725 family protein n=2 Tax=Prolixibacter denitrificans TaxID=1541063 RepID=A0A2P8CED9_9BACT|nr:hypothetical protein CLV93_104270 [Prolixibacter denitrificans]GET21779.1 hypothetical protein JCM18694_20250 [Prolixibacter denitrificans]